MMKYSLRLRMWGTWISPTAVRRVLVAWLFAWGVAPCPSAWAASGHIELVVVEGQGGPPIACRMHLKNAAGRPVKPRGVPFWGDHFVLPGRIKMELPLGKYTFEIERGPEYPICQGHLEMVQFGNDSKVVVLNRKVNMAADGWYAGDLEVYRTSREMELLMAAENVHVAQAITWANGKNEKNEWAGKSLPPKALLNFEGNRYCQLLGGAYTQPGGTLLLLNLDRPLSLPNFESDYPSPMETIGTLRQQKNTWIDLNRPYAWDLPMLVANGGLDSLQLAYAGICRDRMERTETGGRPRDKFKFPDPWGNAQWAHTVYYNLLESGLRIPPSAGSGSGLSPNPVGYNRAYVHVDGELTYGKWWENLRAGQVVITNGPLLQPRVEGELPGFVFQSRPGREVELEIGLTLSMREPISYLEIVQNGQVAHSIPFQEYSKSGRLPKVRFQHSGWLLIRAISDLPKTYRFAMTAPYYVQMGEDLRISKTAAQFFLDWVVERARQIKVDDPQQREAVIRYHRQARDFWQDRVSRANVE